MIGDVEVSDLKTFFDVRLYPGCTRIKTCADNNI